jgi:hypothetical protein
MTLTNGADVWISVVWVVPSYTLSTTDAVMLR